MTRIDAMTISRNITTSTINNRKTGCTTESDSVTDDVSYRCELLSVGDVVAEDCCDDCVVDCGGFVVSTAIPATLLNNEYIRIRLIDQINGVNLL